MNWFIKFLKWLLEIWSHPLKNVTDMSFPDRLDIDYPNDTDLCITI